MTDASSAFKKLRQSLLAVSVTLLAIGFVWWIAESASRPAKVTKVSRTSNAAIQSQQAQSGIEPPAQPTRVRVSRIEEMTPPAKARQIMSKNFLGVNEAAKYLRIEPAEADLKIFAGVPFSEATLKECKDTHILVADFGLSIMQVKEIAPHLFFSPTSGWYEVHSFSKEQGKVCWRLVRKDAVLYSENKTWQDQLKLLPANEEPPAARVMVYTIILRYLATGEKLFKLMYARTFSVSSGPNSWTPPTVGHVVVGEFDGGLRLYATDYKMVQTDTFRDRHVGLASIRRPDY